MRAVRVSLFLLLFLVTAVWAEDRALLVAIGDYPIDGARLPAVGKDVTRIRNAVRTLGYGDRQVRLLVDQDATFDRITGAIRDWLIAGVGASDRVLIYLNGHGSQIRDDDGDEEDGVDEVFLPHDFAPAAGTLRNVLVDDELGRLLAQIPALEVVVLLDTCHSGSLATRSPSGFVGKFYRYPGMPAGGTRGFLLEGPRSEPTNVIAVSAAGEDEKSQTSERTGGLFTRAVAEAVAAAAGRGHLSPERLRSQAAHSIAEALAAEPERVHQPALYGNPELRGINLFLPAPPRPQKVWAEVERLVEAAAGRLEVTAEKSVYSPDSSLAISLRAPRDGHLNVVNLAAGESGIVLLFPNEHHPDNRVTAGERIRIPPPGSFRLPARLPAGIDEQKNLIAVFHTVEPFNLYQRGHTDEAFRIFREEELTEAVRSLHPSGYLAGLIVVTIRR